MRRFGLLLSFFVLTAALSFGASTNAQEYFKLLRQQNLNRLPARFTAEWSGVTIQKKLLTIPKDSYVNKQGRVYVELQYSSKDGLALKVKNVDSLYEGLYQDLPRQVFAIDLILGSEKSEANLARYDISFDPDEGNYKKVRLTLKGALNNLRLFVDPANNRIVRVDYYLGEDLLNSTMVSYQSVKARNRTYLFPAAFITKTFREGQGSRPESFELKGIVVK